MTLTMTPKKNEFERELATALLMENIPLAKVEGKFLKPFIEKYTSKLLPSQPTLRKTYMPKCGNFSFWRPRKPIAFARSTNDKQNYPNYVFRPPE